MPTKGPNGPTGPDDEQSEKPEERGAKVIPLFRAKPQEAPVGGQKLIDKIDRFAAADPSDGLAELVGEVARYTQRVDTNARVVEGNVRTMRRGFNMQSLAILALGVTGLFGAASNAIPKIKALMTESASTSANPDTVPKNAHTPEKNAADAKEQSVQQGEQTAQNDKKEEAKGELKGEIMPETVVAREGLVAEKHVSKKHAPSALGKIMAGDTGALNRKMAVAMNSHIPKIESTSGKGFHNSPAQVTTQSRRAFQQTLRGK